MVGDGRQSKDYVGDKIVFKGYIGPLGKELRNELVRSK
jgi:hypothetical protein